MKILIVNKFLHPQGGSETYIFKVGECLTDMGHEVQYFGMEHKGRIVGNKIEAYTSDMDFHQKGIGRILYPLHILYSKEASKKITQVLNEFDPDVVHVNNFNFQLTPSILYAVKAYSKKKEKKIPLIFTAHDYQLICPNHMLLRHSDNSLCERCVQGAYYNCVFGKCIHGSTIKSILGSLEGYLYKFLNTYRLFDKIICPSEFLEKKMQRNKVFKGKTIALHNFKTTDLSDYKEVVEGAYILYFGRYSKEKGIETLINACRQLPDIPFVFAGSGPLEEEINQVENIANVGFKTGDELKELIQNAAFAIIASEWYENCPFSVMEAQSYGTPVLGADIGGIPELIKNRVTGELFKSGDIDDLLQHIRDMWNHPDVHRQYRKSCRMIKYDTISEYCGRLLKIYQNNNY